ncbi:MAG: CRISPR-associated endonuclease Cas2 [Gammaproteobacteria bacterium]
MSDLYVVCYDIRDARRLRRVANEMENFGTRVLKSVFECHLGEADLKTLKEQLLRWIETDHDQVRIYPVCTKDKPGILLDGPGQVSTDPDYHLC